MLTFCTSREGRRLLADGKVDYLVDLAADSAAVAGERHRSAPHLAFSGTASELPAHLASLVSLDGGPAGRTVERQIQWMRAMSSEASTVVAVCDDGVEPQAAGGATPGPIPGRVVMAGILQHLGVACPGISGDHSWIGELYDDAKTRARTQGSIGGKVVAPQAPPSASRGMSASAEPVRRASAIRAAGPRREAERVNAEEAAATPEVAPEAAPDPAPEIPRKPASAFEKAPAVVPPSPEGCLTVVVCGPRPGRITGASGAKVSGRSFGYSGSQSQEDWERAEERTAEVLENLADRAGATSLRVVSGANQGFEQVALDAAAALATRRPDISITSSVVLPFAGQEGRWSQGGLFGRNAFEARIARADDVTTVSDDPSAHWSSAMGERNHAMASVADVCVAWWGQDGDWKDRQGRSTVTGSVMAACAEAGVPVAVADPFTDRVEVPDELATLLAKRSADAGKGDEVVGTRQAAEILGVSETTVRRKAAAGQISGEKTGGAWGFRREAVDAAAPGGAEGAARMAVERTRGHLTANDYDPRGLDYQCPVSVEVPGFGRCAFKTMGGAWLALTAPSRVADVAVADWSGTLADVMGTPAEPGSLAPEEALLAVGCAALTQNRTMRGRWLEATAGAAYAAPEGPATFSVPGVSKRAYLGTVCKALALVAQGQAPDTVLGPAALAAAGLGPEAAVDIAAATPPTARDPRAAWEGPSVALCTMGERSKGCDPRQQPALPSGKGNPQWRLSPMSPKSPLHGVEAWAERRADEAFEAGAARVLVPVRLDTGMAALMGAVEAAKRHPNAQVRVWVTSDLSSTHRQWIEATERSGAVDLSVTYLRDRGAWRDVTRDATRRADECVCLVPEGLMGEGADDVSALWMNPRECARALGGAAAGYARDIRRMVRAEKAVFLEGCSGTGREGRDPVRVSGTRQTVSVPPECRRPTWDEAMERRWAAEAASARSQGQDVPRTSRSILRPQVQNAYGYGAAVSADADFSVG